MLIRIGIIYDEDKIDADIIADHHEVRAAYSEWLLKEYMPLMSDRRLDINLTAASVENKKSYKLSKDGGVFYLIFICSY